jgi:hypothetical protein
MCAGASFKIAFLIKERRKKYCAAADFAGFQI